MPNGKIIIPETFPLFGRDDEPAAKDKYFGLVNQYNLAIARLTSELLSEISADANGGDISAEDFETDIIEAISPIAIGNRSLRENITKQRKKWGW